jgi:hypothetical protein
MASERLYVVDVPIVGHSRGPMVDYLPSTMEPENAAVWQMPRRQSERPARISLELKMGLSNHLAKPHATHGWSIHSGQ